MENTTENIYYELLKNSKSKTYDMSDIARIITKLFVDIPQYSKYYEAIYMLMLQHYKIHNEKSETPYGERCMAGGKGIMVNLNNLPPDLVGVICEFVESHSI